MSMFRLPRFVRRYIRRNMHPMAEKTAWSMKTKLSIFYAIVAWQAFGFVCYQIMWKENKNWPITYGVRSPDEDLARPAYQWAQSLGIPKAQVVRINKFSSISKVDEVVVHNEESRPRNINEDSNSEQLVD